MFPPEYQKAGRLPGKERPGHDFKKSPGQPGLCHPPHGNTIAVFSAGAQLHTQKLTDLFSVYSDQEMEQLFWLLMKLYTGIERLEQPQREEEKI